MRARLTLAHSPSDTAVIEWSCQIWACSGPRFTMIISSDKCAHRGCWGSQLRKSSPSKRLFGLSCFVWLTIWFLFISTWFTFFAVIMQDSRTMGFYDLLSLPQHQEKTSLFLHFTHHCFLWKATPGKPLTMDGIIYFYCGKKFKLHQRQINRVECSFCSGSPEKDPYFFFVPDWQQFSSQKDRKVAHRSVSIQCGTFWPETLISCRVKTRINPRMKP